MVTIDVLIKKYDGCLVARGLQPTGLRDKLREINFLRHRQLSKEQERECLHPERTKEEEQECISKTRAAINNEFTDIVTGKSDIMDLQKQVHELTQQAAQNLETEAALFKLLEGVHKLCEEIKDEVVAAAPACDDGSSEDQCVKEMQVACGVAEEKAKATAPPADGEGEGLEEDGVEEEEEDIAEAEYWALIGKEDRGEKMK